MWTRGQAPFCGESFKAAIAASGKYEASCNVFSIREGFSVSVGVPYNKRAIEHVRDHIFCNPRDMPQPIIIRVHSTHWNPEQHHGGWQTCSPEELLFGFFLAIARDVRAAKDDDTGAYAKKVADWRVICLSMTMKFEVLETEDEMFWYNIALREMFTTAEKAVARTPRQRIEEIHLIMGKFRRDNGGKVMSAQQLVVAYKDNLKDMKSPYTEQLSEAFIRAALTVKARALVIPEVVQVIKDMEAEYLDKSPWRTIYALLAVVEKVIPETTSSGRFAPYMTF